MDTKIKRKFKSVVGARQSQRRVSKLKNSLLLSLKEQSKFQCNLKLPEPDSNKNLSQGSTDTDVSDTINQPLVCSPAVNFNENFQITGNTTNFEKNYNNKLEFDKSSANTISITLSEKLRHWAIASSIPHTHVTSLLHILSDYHTELSLDCRTLLNTPTNINLKKLDTGEYCHLGISVAISNFLKSHPNISEKILLLSFNIDGIPLFSSTNIQVWPILCRIQNIKSAPFAVGIFCGTGKPYPLNAYFENFIHELNSLLTTGYTFGDVNFKFKIHSFVCDAPARAYVKVIKSHSGYSSCEKCEVTGQYINNRVVLTSLSDNLRTDESFAQQVDEDHHLGISPLSQLPIGLVSQFPIDYMHNVCLGVMRKLLNTWISGPLKTRLQSRVVKLISQKLISLKSYIPAEFNRKPRALSELSRWKATEFRTFLLYLGPIVLKECLQKTVYEHFLLLHCAITILISEVYIKKFGVEGIGEALKNFVKYAENIYGKDFLIYNMHLLSHLHLDVNKFGALDNFSAFPFENYLGNIKKLVKSTKHPIVEIYNRLKERNCLSFNLTPNEFLSSHQFEHNLGPLLDNENCKQYKKIKFNNMTFCINSYSFCDSYFMIENLVVQIENILIFPNKVIKIVGREFSTYSPFFSYPFNSDSINIFIVSNLLTTYEQWVIEDVVAKCVVLKYNNDSQFVSFPLIHSLAENY